ncbi:hypothetical protein ASE36_04460 [Rhizobium sp. Root274]|uniref:hypothetical protein n=1 Tax=unclassified Rhizobium TaxID=2613769 RepID=UPI0007163E25|nr:MULTISPECIES: hypothetical protein [unclassified Rhizobium]KRD33045.1 hypothetical protein ASE36_04460 [Rhizobium sp. Root274]
MSSGLWLLTSAMLNGAMIVVMIFVSLYTWWRLTRFKDMDLDRPHMFLITRLSPGLVGYLAHQNSQSPYLSGIKASAYSLAIAGLARVAEREGEVSFIGTRLKLSRRRMAAIPQATKAVLGSLRGQRGTLKFLSLDELQRKGSGCFASDVQLEYQQRGRIRLFGSPAVRIVVAVPLCLSIAAAYCGGYWLMELLSLFGAAAITGNWIKTLHPNLSEQHLSHRQAGMLLIVICTSFVLFGALAALLATQAGLLLGRTQVVSWAIGCTGIAFAVCWPLLLRIQSREQDHIRRHVLLLQQLMQEGEDLPQPLSSPMSVAHLERYLPLAIALDAEGPWRQRFEDWRIKSGGAVYAPKWQEEMP